ncbi:disease resistance protein RGA4-like [Triticum aestivum]|uniref:disease resistance protein RGA4-like n=1 Tax=Triticum aestivum TaxID=4565 RepID=UPI000844C163|nr:disease resistance protein RGA4-like [Triticum aestivum]
MEFAVSAFGVVASIAMSKLCTVIRKLYGKAKLDATFLKDELEAIRAAIIQLCFRGGPVRCLQIVWISQLRRLAYDIEDSIDCFHANKLSPEEFAIKLGELKERSLDTTDRIKRYGFADQGSAEGSSVVTNYPPDFLLGDKSCHDCLVYLYLFPPNHHVRTKPLIRRWLAEGLVQREDAAVDNLQSIIDSSYIGSIERSINGKVKRCKRTHETLEDIAKRSLSEKFILVCDGTAQLQEEEARRLSVHPSGNVQLNLPQDLPSLRTLAVFPAGAASLASYEDVLDFSRYGQVLRVLDLKECAHLSDEHIQAICEQVLMKYLSINLGSIDEITRDIGKLNQLETLDLSGSQTVTVFKEVLMLPKLKHLIGKFQLSKRDTFWGPVPSDVEKLLRANSKMETLAGFVMGRRPGFQQLLSLMRRLRKVKIWCKTNASSDNLLALSNAISKFVLNGATEPDLNRSLCIDFEEGSRDLVHEIIVPVGGKLDSLKLRATLGKFPQFVAHLGCIEELCLWSTGLSWDVIQKGLSNVKGLKYLKLIEDGLGRIDILSVAGHLKAIERLYIVCRQTLEVAITAAPLPHLVSLHILCQDLHFITGTSGIDITGMAKLQEVALHPLVDGAIRAGLQQAADGHSNMHPPKVMFLEYPQ